MYILQGFVHQLLIQACAELSQTRLCKTIELCMVSASLGNKIFKTHIDEVAKIAGNMFYKHDELCESLFPGTSNLGNIVIHQR